MTRCSRPVTALRLLAVAALVGPASFFADVVSAQGGSPEDPAREAPALFTYEGERLPQAAIGKTVVEDMEGVRARRIRYPSTTYDHRRRVGAQGEWIVPSQRFSGTAHSGVHYITNERGDPRMGIGFGASVDVRGAWILGHSDASTWPASIVAVGYRSGAEVARTKPFTSFTSEPIWLEMALAGVDRIEIEAEPNAYGGVQYGMDDLTFDAGEKRIVVDFDDRKYRDRLTGSGYANLDWELGTGDSNSVEVVHAPFSRGTEPEQREEDQELPGGGGSAPTLLSSFLGPGFRTEAGSNFVPPDTCGAVGIDHFVSIVNQNLSAYVKTSGTRVLDVDLRVFFGVSGECGDPRVGFDPTSQHFFVLATDFIDRIFVAYSNTSDPTGAWTKTSFITSQGTDTGAWPDYPTLGMNSDFVTTCALMVSDRFSMTCFAIDKNAWLSTGVLTVKAFRNLVYDAGMHPAVTWDATAPQFMVSPALLGLRIRRLDLPANDPTLSDLGVAPAPNVFSPPWVPQLDGPPFYVLEGRLMNSIWVNGSLWTTHCIGSGGRAASRWYQIDTASITVAQSGTVRDPSLSYFMPSIAVNANGNVALGFSGSSPDQYPGAYFTGRRVSDPPGEMGIPVQYKAGEGAYIDPYSGPRWGDYSLTSLDPTNELRFWTIQEYARPRGEFWSTFIAEMGYDEAPCGSVANFCSTSPNSVGAGSLISATGSPFIAANDFGVATAGNPPSEYGVFFMGLEETSAVFGDGFLCVSGGITRYPVVQSDASGVASMLVDTTLPPALSKIVAGATWKWQYWYRDPMGAGSGFNLSNGLSVTYCP